MKIIFNKFNQKRQSTDLFNNPLKNKLEWIAFMIRIVRIPEVLDNFFSPFESHFNKRSFVHFKIFCFMIALSSSNKTVSQIASYLTFGTHRTKLNDFLLQSPWNEVDVLKDMAHARLKKIYKKSNKKSPVFVILDDSKKKKTGKHVQGAGKIYDPVSKTYIKGHQFLAATIYYKGHTIPYLIKLYLKKEVAKELKEPFKKLTTLAQEIIEQIDIPFDAPIYVLTDSFYSNKKVVNAARAKGFHYIGTLKENRTFTINGKKTNVSTYTRNSFKRKTKLKTKVATNRGLIQYSFISTIASVSTIGSCQLAFSRKGSKRKIIAIACTDEKLNPKNIILYYSFRWSIEVWFKQAKQHLSLGALHRQKLSGVIKHLHLSACAYLLLTHLNISSAKGKNENHVVVSLLSLQDKLKEILLADMFDAYIESQQSTYVTKVIANMKKEILNIPKKELFAA